MLLFLRFLQVQVINAILTSVYANEYCNLKECQDHTMCKYSDDIACPGEGAKAGLNDDQRKAILDYHNELRQKVAQGKEDGQPAAANMMKMSWNTEAEEIAQRWANQCIMGHDSCRILKNGKQVGQNAAQDNLDRRNIDRTKVVKNSVKMWYDEVKYMTDGVYDSFNMGSPDRSVGHYSQVVWATSSQVGCGYLEKPATSSPFQQVILICNYVPAGNFRNQPIFQKGKACSACPEGTRCSKRYDGLCTNEKDEYADIPGGRKGTGNQGQDAYALFVSFVVVFHLLQYI